MPKLIISSLFDPIEIEIDGEVFKVERLTRALLLKIGELMEEDDDKSLESGYKVLELVLGERAYEVISELDIRRVNEIVEFIKDNISPSTSEEKNESKPGDEPSP